MRGDEAPRAHSSLPLSPLPLCLSPPLSPRPAGCPAVLGARPCPAHGCGRPAEAERARAPTGQAPAPSPDPAPAGPHTLPEPLPARAWPGPTREGRVSHTCNEETHSGTAVMEGSRSQEAPSGLDKRGTRPAARAPVARLGGPGARKSRRWLAQTLDHRDCAHRTRAWGRRPGGGAGLGPSVPGAGTATSLPAPPPPGTRPPPTLHLLFSSCTGVLLISRINSANY